MSERDFDALNDRLLDAILEESASRSAAAPLPIPKEDGEADEGDGARRALKALDKLARVAWGSAIAVVALDSEDRVALQAAAKRLLREPGATRLDHEHGATQLIAWDVGSGAVGGAPISPQALGRVYRAVSQAVSRRPQVRARLAAGRGFLGKHHQSADRIVRATLALDPAPGEVVATPTVDDHVFARSVERQLRPSRWSQTLESLQAGARWLLDAVDVGFAPALAHRDGEAPSSLQEGQLIVLRHRASPALFRWVVWEREGMLSLPLGPDPLGAEGPESTRATEDVVAPTEVERSTTLSLTGPGASRPLLLVSDVLLVDLERRLGDANTASGRPIDALLNALNQTYPTASIGIFGPPPVSVAAADTRSPFLIRISDALTHGHYDAIEALIAAGEGAAPAAERLRARGLWGRALRNQGELQAAYDLLLTTHARAAEIGAHAEEGLAARELAKAAFDLIGAEAASAWLAKAKACHALTGEAAARGRDLLAEGVFAYRQGDWARALELYSACAHLAEVSQDRALLGPALNNLGQTHQELGQLEEALRCVRRAEVIYEELDDRHNAARLWGDIGLISLDQGRPQDALVAFQRQLGFMEEVGSPRDRVSALTGLAQALHQTGGFAEALQCLEEAEALLDAPPSLLHSALWMLRTEISLATRDLAGAERSLSMLHGEEANRLDVLWRSKVARAELDAANRLPTAEAAYREAIDAVEAARAELPRAHRAHFLAASGRLWESWITYLSEGGEALPLLAAMEQARGRGLMDALLAQSGYTPGAHTPMEATEGIQAGLRDLQRGLPEGTALIQTHVLAQQLLLIWVDRDEIALARLPKGRLSLRSWAERVKDDCTTRRGRPLSKSAWRALGESLLHPFEARLSRLPPGGAVGFVRHPDLAGVPIHALPFGAQGHPLVARIPVFYAPTVLSGGLQPPQGDSRPERGIILGDPAGDLPSAAAEARDIKARLPALQLLLGEDASARALWEGAPDAELIHIAAHAQSRSASSPAHLALAPSQTQGSGSDAALARAFGSGRMDAALLTRLPTQAQLVVLSACESGSGEITSAGEGPQLLPWALLSAGAGSVIATEWRVPDLPSRNLLHKFYDLWFRGYTTVDALATAQRGMMNDPAAAGLGDAAPPSQCLPGTRIPPWIWAGHFLTGGWR